MTLGIVLEERVDIESLEQKMRKDALLKLIRIEPDHFEGLVQATGWGEAPTQLALTQLVKEGLVRRLNRGGRQRFYAVRTESVAVGHP